MNLRHSYTLFAPIYDLVLRRASDPLRRASLAAFDAAGKRVLLAGVGSGLDLPHLPRGAQYVGVDLTPAMLRRARRRARQRGDVVLHLGNVMALPYPDHSFDAVVMHLILAVVPHPQRALQEARRVLKPGGEVLILDKFLRPGQRAPLRRALNTLSRRVATRMDVVFEEVLACCEDLKIERDAPALAGGWFRHIRLRKAS
jgi:ubiquinone/menaquinone biosynthesis C-methylase UbiE